VISAVRSIIVRVKRSRPGNSARACRPGARQAIGAGAYDAMTQALRQPGHDIGPP
jgi:hypothetical protein